MQTEFPTVEFYFVFAFTYCKLRVYRAQEKFTRNVLEIHDVEFLKRSDSDEWQDIDTRVWLDLVHDALPKMLEEAGVTGNLLDGIKKSLNIRILRDER